MYEYHAFVLYVVDGDTIDVEIDLGFGIAVKHRLRLLGVDTPEIFHPSCPDEKLHGLEAKEFVEDLILSKVVTVVTKKDKQGKYGRYLADVISNGESLVWRLKQEGFEKKSSYGPK